MKAQLLLSFLVVIFSVAAHAERPGFRPGGFRGHAGGVSSGGQRPQLTAEQEAAFASCVQSQGVAMPARPTPPTEEKRASLKAAFQTCRQTATDKESLKGCMATQGFTPPPRPSEEQMAALHTCRDQVLTTATATTSNN